VVPSLTVRVAIVIYYNSLIAYPISLVIRSLLTLPSSFPTLTPPPHPYPLGLNLNLDLN